MDKQLGQLGKWGAGKKAQTNLKKVLVKAFDKAFQQLLKKNHLEQVTNIRIGRLHRLHVHALCECLCLNEHVCA